MVKDLKTKANELEELNNNLEEKVEEKTKKLKELLQVQDRFVKNAIHEINTPITIMLTNIDLMTLTGEKNRYLSKIEAASKIIHNIYNDLSYAVKKDFHHYEKTKINFSEFLNSRVTFFEEVALANSINFKTNIEDNVFIEFNEIELQRICDNNLSNAIKYSYEESEVEVILRNNELIFENSGNKIENIDKIFNRYYREDSARGGFGIGLNLVKEICDKNEIYIEINSENGINSFKYKGFK
jgi:signal transduction histidine kinase